MAKIEWRNAGEILGMGGPWMGELCIDGVLIDGQVMDGPLCDEGEEWCVYVVQQGKPKWMKSVRFQLNAYHIPSGRRVAFDLERDMLVLCEVGKGVAVVKHAYHKDHDGDKMPVPLPQFDEDEAIRLPWSEIKR
jgi:hypothetical protein